MGSEMCIRDRHEPGKYASWIAAPDQGIDNKSGDFEYVKVHDA